MIKKAQQAKDMYEKSVKEEDDMMNQLIAEYENALGDSNKPTIGPNGKPLITTLTDFQKGTIKAEDSNGNPITVPGGFKVRVDLGDTVQKGVVIEDKNENQFVWIPVSNTNGNGSNPVIKDDGSKVEITLGRYSFNETSGNAEVQQLAINYTQTATIQSYYQESNRYQVSNGKEGTDGTNTTAKDLSSFITSANDNHGYYLARYEASYGSARLTAEGEKYTIASKPSTKVPPTEELVVITKSKGLLFSNVTQKEAATVSQDMYNGDQYVESDLTNSYAWDTAIVYIQAMGHNGYANKIDGNGELKNTGETGDVKCNIYDMSGNCFEWVTETSSNKTSTYAYPCTIRGGAYTNDSYKTSSRYYGTAIINSPYTAFRPIIYNK